MGDERSYAWVVDSGSLRSVRLAPRAEIETVARDVAGLVTARGVSRPGETAAQRRRRIAEADLAAAQALRRLSELVIVPLGSLNAAQRLLVVPDGALQYIPFGMLPIDAREQSLRPMVLDFEIVTMPSASVLAIQREQIKTRAGPGSGVAVIADPVFDRTDTRFDRLVPRRK